MVIQNTRLQSFNGASTANSSDVCTRPRRQNDLLNKNVILRDFALLPSARRRASQQIEEETAFAKSRRGVSPRIPCALARGGEIT
jgi:hypothetical protein